MKNTITYGVWKFIISELRGSYSIGFIIMLIFSVGILFFTPFLLIFDFILLFAGE